MSDSRDKVISEVLGVLFLALTGLLIISLVTYSPADAWDNGAQVANYVGLVGAWLARGLLIPLGISSYLIPLFCLSVAIGCFRETRFGLDWLKLIGGLLLLLTSSVLIALYIRAPLTVGGIKFSSPAGVVGGFIKDQLLLPYLNVWGSYLITIALLIISLMLTTGLSWARFFSQLERLSSHILNLTDVEDKPSPKQRKKKAPPPDTDSLPIITSHHSQEHSSAGVAISEFPPPGSGPPGNYQYPSLSLLEIPKQVAQKETIHAVPKNSSILKSKLKDFGVEGHIAQVHTGPVITRYEFVPAPGIKINQVANLADDLALAMRASAVRIVAPIPGKAAVGIEVPNQKRELIYLREILGSENFRQTEFMLPLALGKDIAGVPYVTDLAKMPHLLIAGATGSGKSVALNTLVCSILYSAAPQKVRLVMLDPKMLELGIYDGIPHLLVPVVTDAKKAAEVLLGATCEMERRYQQLALAQVRNIDQYNNLVAKNASRGGLSEAEEELQQPMPRIVIIIDEFADLMMVASKNVETLITRLTQMSRAVGIHLVIATQRPSVDVITGLIKANFPSRISFRVSSRIDSRTILDSMGAERLLGRGDMLFLPPGSADLVRIHGAMVTEKEVKRIVDFLTHHEAPQYDTSILTPPKEALPQGGGGDEYDEMYDKAVEFVMQRGEASISLIQRCFRIGYNRAARMVEIMERDGLVGPSVGGKPRKVLVSKEL